MVKATTRAVLLAALLLQEDGCAGIVRDQFYNQRSKVALTAFKGPAPKEVFTSTRDGLRLRGGWWSAAIPGAPVLIFFHGRSGDQDEAARYAEPLRATGANILVASYRGYGGNSGRPSEANLLLDARSFFALANSLAPNSRVYLVGHSLGAAVAIELAAAPDTRPLVAGVITIGAFAKLREVTPALVKTLLTERFDNQAAIGAVHEPVVLIHAQADSVVPISQAQRLLAAAPDKSLLVVLSGENHRADMDLVGQIISTRLKDDPKDLKALIDLSRARRFAIFRKDVK